jgi:hypothetical protein
MILILGSAATLLTGCGGSASNSNTTTPVPKTYNITVTASSASLQHTASVTLNVQYLAAPTNEAAQLRRSHQAVEEFEIPPLPGALIGLTVPQPHRNWKDHFRPDPGQQKRSINLKS